MTGFEATVEKWLGEDQRRPRKQRHTAKRVFDRLVAAQGFSGSYSPVQRFVKKWNALHRQAGEGFTELVWPAGTAQVDFGQAEAIVGGIRQVLHIFVVTFPFSNMRFVQAYRGETAEGVCHGLRTVFDHIGAAPRHLVFDNATGIGRRVGTKVVETKLFGAFKLHYRSESRYCNPYSGNEKGSPSVAKKVITTLVDDIDGTEINDGNGETIAFALDGIGYEIDLTAANAAALREALAAYVKVARQVKNRTASPRSRVKLEDRGAELAAIREWARSNGHPAPGRGRIPASTVAAYEAATK